MGFWGLEIKPGKPYTYQHDNARGSLHLTQATLGDGLSTKKSTVKCAVGDKSPVFLCSLFQNKIETCPLNLEFEENDSVLFSVSGTRSVHLSGFFKLKSTDDESDAYAEDIADTESEESSDYDDEDEYDRDFINDGDFGIFAPSPVPNSGVVIEEIVDDKPANADHLSKKTKKKKKTKKLLSDSKVKPGSAEPVLETEDENGFLILQKPKAVVEEKMEQITTKTNKKKRPRDVSDNLERGAEILENGITEKNKKERKQQSTEGNDLENGDVNKSNEMNVDVDTDHVSDKNTPEENKNKKKKKKKKKKSKGQEETTGDASVASQGQKNVTIEEKKPSQVRTFSNGLVIEELAMGKPDGKKASRGNKVSVHYTGKLKKDDSIFDSSVGKTPFEFRLGVGQAIKGWDVGVHGMRIGDKRKLTIPPSMGYGEEGAGKKIPPNSWLVFEVELVDVC